MLPPPPPTPPPTPPVVRALCRSVREIRCMPIFEKTNLDKVILSLLNACPKKDPCPLPLGEFWGRDLARKGCWWLASGLLCNPVNNALDYCLAFVTFINFSSIVSPNK